MPVSADELCAWHGRPGRVRAAQPSLRSRRGRGAHRRPGGRRTHADRSRSGCTRTASSRRTTAPASWSIIDIEYALPLGGLGDALRGPLHQPHPRAHVRLPPRADPQRSRRGTRPSPRRPRLTVAVTGASGLVGSALIPFLTTGGHTVRPVKRTGAEFDASALEGADVVVNLAGAGVADARWTDERKRLLAESRVDYTRKLLAARRSAAARSRRCGSRARRSACTAIAPTRCSPRTRSSARRARAGPGFLAKLCLDWEAAGHEAASLGARVVTAAHGHRPGRAGRGALEVAAGVQAGRRWTHRRRQGLAELGVAGGPARDHPLRGVHRLDLRPGQRRGPASGDQPRVRPRCWAG